MWDWDKRLHNGVAGGLVVLIFGIVLLVAYSNTFSSPFFFDDYGYVVGNPYVDITSLSFDALRDAALKSPGKMRALANISFALNHYLHGNRVFGFHLVNFLIHLGTAITAYFLFVKTMGMAPVEGQIKNVREIAFISALLWAVHPLHTNSVTYIIQRMNSMAALFLLLSMLCYANGRGVLSKARQIGHFGAAFVFGVLATLSKENALMLPVLIGGYELFFISEIKNQKGLQNAVFFIVGAGLFLLGTALFIKGGDFSILSGYAGKKFSLVERLLTEPRVIIFYLSLLVLPLPSRLNLLHDIPLSTNLVSPPQTIGAMLTIMMLLGAIVWSYKKERLISFALFWFFGNLLIESSVLPLALVFEHRTYIPSIFLALAVASLVYQHVKKREIVRIGAALLVVTLVALTWQRNQVWCDSLSLWSDVAEKSPNLSRGHLGRFFALQRQGKGEDALQALLKAVAVQPDDSRAMTNLVNHYMGQNKYVEAIKVLNGYLAVKQTAAAYIDRAKAHAMLKQYDKTFADAERAIKIAPKSRSLSENRSRSEKLEN